jgi:hypothetical protein
MRDDEFHWLLQQGVSDTHGTGPSAGEYEPLDRTKNTIEHTGYYCRPHIAVRLVALFADKRACSDVNSISWTESRHKGTDIVPSMFDESASSVRCDQIRTAPYRWCRGQELRK